MRPFRHRPSNELVRHLFVWTMAKVECQTTTKTFVDLWAQDMDKIDPESNLVCSSIFCPMSLSTSHPPQCSSHLCLETQALLDVSIRFTVYAQAGTEA